jgi:YbbR domain-containing protein
LSNGFSLGKVRVDPKKVKIITGKELLNLNDHLEVEFHSMVILDHDY